MTGCKKYGDSIIDYAAGEATSQQENQVKEHLAVCPGCHREYLEHKRIFQETGELDSQIDQVMEEIDWQAVSNSIHKNIRTRHSAQKNTKIIPMYSMKIALPAAAALVILGLLMGYLLFNTQNLQKPAIDTSPEGKVTLARLETTLAKKEVGNFFKQTQLVFTDLMRQCDPQDRVLWWNRLNKQRVKYLLEKSRYFTRDLDNPHLMATRGILKKIEWILFEMITLEDHITCRRLQQLQDYIHKEKLLLKIRLLEQNVTVSEV